MKNRNSMTKPYGNGFDSVVRQADIRAFTNWWNDRSHFPVGTGSSKG